MAFIQLTSPLILAGDPTLPNHAATKQYVDFKANNIDAAGFSSGLLNVMRLPALVGDVTMEAGSGTLVLTNTGVNPGTYTRISVSVRGRITAGGVLSADDMPNISWDKITSGLPTTLAGYGISNVIGMSGGTITGVLTSSAVPSASLHLVTKSYVDSMIQPSGDSLATGDIVRKGIVSTSPSGFLRANGGKVSKTTYAALYSILGDRYEVLMTNGVEQPFAHMEPLGLSGALSGDIITNAAPANSFSSYADNLAVFITHNKLYLISSYNAGGYRYAKTFRNDLNSDGTLGPWTDMTDRNFGGGANIVNENVSNMNIFMTKNKVWYMFHNLGAPNLYYSDIDSNGLISQQYSTTPPAGIVAGTTPVVIKNRLYLIDYNFVGTTGPMEVAYRDIDANGNLSGITGLGNIHSSAVKGTVMDAFVIKNRLFVILYNGSAHQVFYAAINSDATLGSWTAGPTVSGLSSATRARAITTTSGITLPLFATLWFYDGNGGSYQSTGMRYLTLNTDAAGLPISWNLSAYLTNPATGASGKRLVIAKNRMYLGFSHNSWSIGSKSVSFSQGLNSYKPYYDGTYTVSDPNNFYLPDFTSKETNNTKYYVKT